MVLDSDIKCTIFRHGVYKGSMEPINPHSPKDVCDALVSSGKIWGCGKPFKFDGNIVEICDYI